MIDLIGEIFFFGIMATPFLGWLMVRRKHHLAGMEKLIRIVVIAAVLSLFFFFIAMTILLRNGLGPV